MLYKHLKKSLHYTYKTNETAVCYRQNKEKLHTRQNILSKNSTLDV